MSEGGAGTKRSGIPEWQKAAPAEQKPDNGSTAAAPAQPDIVEQGRRFLQDESVKDASLEQKTAFLESKGLSKTQVDQAVLSAQKPVTQPSQTTNTMTSAPQQSQVAPPQPPRDAPPIITYPEFLMHAQQPPPIITAKRLINTAYVASAVGAAFYVASKYFLAPMTANMTEARHDFASHVQEKLNDLSSKLTDAVSVVPKETSKERHNAIDDVESVDSDPTELYHRDYGTQTSPKLVPDKIDDSSSDSTAAEDGDDLMYQTDKIRGMTSIVKQILEDDNGVVKEDEEVLTVMRVLREYLESLAMPVYTSTSTYAGISNFTSNKDTVDDEVSKFKAEIRSVKGTLLSARNFPSTVRRAGLWSSQGAATPT